MSVEFSTLGHQPSRPQSGPPTEDRVSPGETPQDVPIDVTLHVKSTDDGSLRTLRDFARKNGLSVAGVDSHKGTVQLHGTAGQYDQAFGIRENDFVVIANGEHFRDFVDSDDHGGEVEGKLKLPDNVAGNIVRIDGLDTTPAVIPPGIPLPPE